MASGKSNYLIPLMQKLIIGATAFSAPGTVAFALSTAAFTTAATGASMTEVANSGSYARVSTTNNTTNYPVATPTVNANAITWTTATGSWGTILSAYAVDSATYGAGNVLLGADITSKAVGSGDTVSIAAGSFSYGEA